MGKEVNLIPKIDQDDFKFEKLIEHHGKSVVIFSADWCPYCVSFFNNWNEYSDVSDVFIADITDVESKLWDVFNINVVPTMAVFENGALKKRWDGPPNPVLTNNKIKTHCPKNKVTSKGNLAKKQIGSQIDKRPGKAINKSANALPFIINNDSTGLDFIIHNLFPSTPSIVEPSIVHCNNAPR